MISFNPQQKYYNLQMKKAVKEEWVELTDGKYKIIMPRREMVNLARRVSRVFAAVKVY